MNIAPERNPFMSAVSPEQDNVIPFRKPPPYVPPTPTELSFNELIMSFHAGQPYLAFFRPDYDKIAELRKTQPDYQFDWRCAVCHHIPELASMRMLSPTACICDSCYTSISTQFPIK